MNRGSPGAVVFIFILLFFLIAVAYYVGTTTDALALGKAGQQFAYAVTGRTSTGTFAGYPTGGGTAPAVSF
jgi:hypothetical protein